MTTSVEISNRTKSRAPINLLAKVAADFLADYHRSQNVSVALIGDGLMRRLNRQTRGQDKVTDVLSFRDADAVVKNREWLGEVLIDYQQIKRQAKVFQTGVRRELLFILVHGLLHLIGYDDKTKAQAETMDRLAKKFLAKHHYD